MCGDWLLVMHVVSLVRSLYVDAYADMRADMRIDMCNQGDGGRHAGM